MCETNVDEESPERRQRWRQQKRRRTGKQQRSKPKNPQEITKTMKEYWAMRETKQCKKNKCQPTKQCFETTNAGKKTYIRKTKNIYAYICEDEEEEREFKKLTLHKWNVDAAEGDELKVRTRNEGKDEK